VSDTSKDQPDSIDISALLALGAAAKKKQYHTMLSRIAKGETLNGGELKAFDLLDRELRNIDEAQGAAKAGATETLPNLVAVVAHLNKQGWKIKKSAAYKHRQEGKVRATPTGAFLVSDVDKYAATYLTRLDGSPTPADQGNDLQRERSIEEIRKARAQADHWELKTRIASGEFVPRDLFERDLAARATIFRADVENFVRGHAPGIIAMVDGDVQKIPDLIEFMLIQAEIWLARYSESQEFKIDVSAYEGLFCKASTGEDQLSDDGEDDEDDGITCEYGGPQS
jgi:hypothetical protein